jgi:glutathione S-transferase
VLAESAFIIQYLCDHFPNTLVPKRWKDGQEGKVGGDTEGWLRYQYLMYFAEGTFMAWLVQYFVFSRMSPPPASWDAHARLQPV